MFCIEAEMGLLDEKMAEMRAELYAVRKRRKQPMLDTKILTSWNALMIRGSGACGDAVEAGGLCGGRTTGGGAVAWRDIEPAMVEYCARGRPVGFWRIMLF